MHTTDKWCKKTYEDNKALSPQKKENEETSEAERNTKRYSDKKNKDTENLLCRIKHLEC